MEIEVGGVYRWKDFKNMLVKVLEVNNGRVRYCYNTILSSGWELGIEEFSRKLKPVSTLEAVLYWEGLENES